MIGGWLNKFYLENKNSKVTEIDLNFNEIGDIGARLLSKIIIRNKSLLSLNVSNNKISQVGLNFIFIGISTV